MARWVGLLGNFEERQVQYSQDSITTLHHNEHLRQNLVLLLTSSLLSSLPPMRVRSVHFFYRAWARHHLVATYRCA